MKTQIPTLLSAAFAIGSVASPQAQVDPVPSPQTYVLVHGAWQAPFVWDVVTSDLEAAGNKVIVAELPGHGADHTATYTLSMDGYRDKVIDALPSEGAVILVGHSMGGMVISAVAERVPERISKLVYIGAFLPTNGQALTDLAFSDPDSKLGPLLIESEDKLTLDVKDDQLTWLFIDDGDPAIKQTLRDQYRAEPAIPLTNPVTLTPERFGTVPKVYIKTLQDRVVSPGLQDRMITATDIQSVFTVNTSHSPFLSQPGAVSDLLLAISAQ